MWRSAKYGLTHTLTRRREGGWARVVSDLLSPPVIWGLVAVPVARHGAESFGAAAIWAGLYALLVCLMPALYIAYGVWRGHITDMHIAVREQRLKPYLVTLAGTALAFVLLSLLGAPRLLPIFAIFSFVQVAFICLVTLRWQISLHAMSISGAVVIMGGLYGVGVALLLTPLIVLVSVARVRLQRHTPRQVIAGSLAGCLLTAAMFVLSGAN